MRITTTQFHPRHYKTAAYVEYATVGWVNWYDNRRLCIAGSPAPIEYEQVN